MKRKDIENKILSLPKYQGKSIESGIFYVYRAIKKHDSGYSGIYVYTDDYFLCYTDVIFFEGDFSMDMQMDGVICVISNSPFGLVFDTFYKKMSSYKQVL